MPDEKTTVTAGASAPAAEVITQTAVPAAGQNVQSAQTPVVPTSEPGLPKGVTTELVKLRADRRELREEVKRLRETVEKISASSAPKEEIPSFVDDPDKRLAWERDKIKSEILGEVRQQQTVNAESQQIEEEGRSAIQWVKERPEINGNSDLFSEVDEIIESDPKLAKVVKVSPQIAAEKAYAIWKERKGLGSGRVAVAANDANSILKPPVASSSSRAPRTIADIKSDLQKINPKTDPNYKQKLRSLEAELSSHLG